MAEMVNYLREWNKRNILVRPTKWNGAEEVAPWDCLDITNALRNWQDYMMMSYKLDEILLRNPIAVEIQKNYKLYRSPHFSKNYADNPRMKNPFFGCCVVATEALSYLIDGDAKPMCFKAKDYEGIWHWWIMCHIPRLKSYFPKHLHMPYTDIAVEDATASQFSGIEPNIPPYAGGKKTSFMGWKQSPSKRTLDLIERITPSSKRYKCYDKTYAPPSSGASLVEFFTEPN